MASRLKLIVAYDGAPFSGWQSQPNGNGVQDHLEKAFAQIAGSGLRVHGAGRTDAGVHALAQCAHVDLASKRYSSDRWRSALNGLLPRTIRILRCGFVAGSFHARFSATAKIYRYRIWNAEVLPPLEEGRAWHVREPLDFAAMSRVARLFLGRHDFASFAANRGAPATDTVRTLRRLQLRRAGPLISMEMEGDGFLYKMARLMAGALVQVGLGKATAADLEARLRYPEKKLSQGRTVAPSGGLFLVRVRY
jgi:tRNA pseudouridine38-40 synthase